MSEVDEQKPERRQRLRLTINGSEREELGPLTVRELLDRLSLPKSGVAVERNKEIVPRDRHAEQELADGDQLEIVTLVGGG